MKRLIWRILAVACFAMAFGLFLRDAAAEGPLMLSALGAFWSSLDPGGPERVQAAVWPGLWDGVLLPVLRWPAVWVFFVPGVIFALLGYWPRRRD